ncbi:MAG TPA: hypothetical protein VFT52_02425 [Luteimonas sp.]|nr:hypothetical protein [Luteimonas sp.]
MRSFVRPHCLSLASCLLAMGGASAQGQDDAPVGGDGQAVVVPWTPAPISSGLFESHAAFDPRTRAVYFVRSAEDFSGWHLMESRCGPAGWSEPASPAFAAPGLEADPWLTPDGDTLYFISTRATGAMRSADLDIWMATRKGDTGWSAPVRLPAPVNSPQAEWFPRLAADGWLYFGSNRTGGAGGNDIWRARRGADGAWQVENAGPAINTAANEYEPLPSPDGTTLLVMADGGLYRSQWRDGAWTPKEKLPAPVNTNGSEIGAAFSPSGRSLLFARDTGPGRSGEFFVWRIDGTEDWPPRCPQ